MNDAKYNMTQKLKDFFLIQKIRIANFIKEHKYISAFIGIFLFSCIVALIVYASDNDEYKGKVEVSAASVTSKSSSSTSEIKEIPSFSTLVYDIDYNLSIKDLKNDKTVIRNVVVEATMVDDIDAEWLINDEEANYELSDDKKKMTVTIYGSQVGENLSKQLYLRVGNIKNGTLINTTFKIKEETASDYKKELSSSVKAVSEQATLTARVVPGTAYKSEKIENGRLAPFGILVGLEKSKYPNGLSGLYFDPNFSLVLESTQTVRGKTSQIELEEDEKFYGTYDSSTKLLPGMLNYKLDYFNKSVYDSGSVKSLKKSESGVMGELKQSKSPLAYLIGDKEINLEVDDTYKEYGISTTKNISDICRTNFKNCKRTITDKTGKEVDVSKVTEKEGNYKVSYEYSSGSDKVTLYRTINVTKKETKEMQGSVYSLNDKKIIILLKGETYKEPGLIKDGQILTSYESLITKNGESTSSISTKEPGEYKITYTVTGTNKKDVENDKIIFERTIKVVDSLPSIESQILTANTIYTPSNGKYSDPSLNIDSKDFICNSSSNCSVKYYDIITNEEVSKINTNKAGTYKAVYKVTDKNGFILETTNDIHFITKYDFDIINIKSNGKSYLYDNNFIALGSYFVNARSVRDSSINDDIAVDLKAYVKQDNNLVLVSKETSVNKNYSKGTKTNSLEFETNEKTLAYGEDTVLKSLFSYSTDGDSNIKELTVKVPISTGISTAVNSTAPFNMIEYSSNSKNPYYISGLSEKQEVTVKYYACLMEETKTTCKNEAKEFDSYEDENIKKEGLTLAYLTYTIKEVKPGQNIDFRIRLKTNVGNHGGTITLTSTANYKEIESDGTTKDVQISSEPSAKINITAFKARTKVLVGSSEQDVIINGAEKNNSTFSIYPTVSLPSEVVNTNLASINELKSILITVTLPSGLNYVYNENYMLPRVSNNGKTLTYDLRGQKVNEWIDPILFDVSYDIDIPSGEKKDVSVVIQATSSTDITDASDLSERTTVRSIIYQNNEAISYNQYASNVAISKDTNFYVGAKLYNNDNKVHNNISLVTVLPYNDVGNEKAAFTGTYTISDLPKDALCTLNLPALVSKEENLKNQTEIEWKNCDDYKKDDYLGVTAIKIDNINLDKGQSYDQKITINPKGNKTDDSYQIKSYLIYDSTIKSIPALTVSVISKKITGTVWEDFDSDGVMGTDEKKVSGVTLKLYSSDSNELVKTATTNEKGNYSLTDLKPGTYYVVAEYNTAKYGVSPYQVKLDKSITSQFKSVSKTNEDKKTDTSEDKTEETETKEEEKSQDVIVRTDDIEITENTRQVGNINLGLALRKEYSVKLTKYITKAITTNRLGVSVTRDYGNATLAKLDVKDINNLSIKVIYTLELENTGYYPGYIYKVKDYIPDGMSFNDKYEENKGWIKNDNGYLENNTLSDQLINSGEKKYLTIAFDITKKEAGSFINYASVDDEDLQILVVAGQNEEGEQNEQ